MVLCIERDSLRREHHATVQIFRAYLRDLVALVDTSATDLDLNQPHRRIRIARRACEGAQDSLGASPSRTWVLKFKATHYPIA